LLAYQRDPLDQLLAKLKETYDVVESLVANMENKYLNSSYAQSTQPYENSVEREQFVILSKEILELNEDDTNVPSFIHFFLGLDEGPSEAIKKVDESLELELSEDVPCIVDSIQNVAQEEDIPNESHDEE